MEQWFAYGALGEEHRYVDASDTENHGKCVHGSPLIGSSCGICQQNWDLLVFAGKWTQQTVVAPSRAEVDALNVHEGENGPEVEQIVMPEDLMPDSVESHEHGIPGHVDEADMQERTVNEEVTVREPSAPLDEEES